jgi:hypothetical protein
MTSVAQKQTAGVSEEKIASGGGRWRWFLFKTVVPLLRRTRKQRIETGGTSAASGRCP